MDLARQLVVVNGTPVKLTPIECKLLYILLRAAGRTVTTGFFIQRGAGYTFKRPPSRNR